MSACALTPRSHVANALALAARRQSTLFKGGDEAAMETVDVTGIEMPIGLRVTGEGTMPPIMPACEGVIAGGAAGAGHASAIMLGGGGAAAVSRNCAGNLVAAGGGVHASQ